eukprot:jgi/Botrbrau1/17362/Bobra.0015s0103.1
MDNYNDASRIIDQNFDDPRLTDYDTLLRNIQDLKDGKTTQVPIYDFKQSKRVGYKETSPPKSKIVIIEGIYALSSRIRPQLDLRVSITGGVHFDLVKRVLRDIDRSGQAPEEIIQQISDTVYPMYKAYIEPDLKEAQLRIYNTFNPFSGFMNATYILKSAKPVSDEQIKAVLESNHNRSIETETYDIYLLPPNEDIETCASWLRMRNRDGRYNLMFEEWVVDGPFIISPRITFEVSVRILGGLMALGYEIGTIMKRASRVYSDDSITIKIDDIEGMPHQYIQIQGKDRKLVADVGRKLGLEGTYIARSYIEQVQLEKLISSFQHVTDDMKQRFKVEGGFPLEDAIAGTSPAVGHTRITGFHVPIRQPSLASSAPSASRTPMRSTGGRPSSAQRSESHQNGLLSHAMRSDSHRSFAIHTPNGFHNGEKHRFTCSGSSSEDGDNHQHRPPVTRMERLLSKLQAGVDRVSEVPSSVAAQFEAQTEALVTQQRALNQVLEQLTTVVDALRHDLAVERHKSPPYYWLIASAAVSAVCSVLTITFIRVIG